MKRYAQAKTKNSNESPTNSLHCPNTTRESHNKACHEVRPSIQARNSGGAHWGGEEGATTRPARPDTIEALVPCMVAQIRDFKNPQRDAQGILRHREGRRRQPQSGLAGRAADSHCSRPSDKGSVQCGEPPARRPLGHRVLAGCANHRGQADGPGRRYSIVSGLIASLACCSWIRSGGEAMPDRLQGSIYSTRRRKAERPTGPLI